jgi:hypothetical protein
MSNVSQKGEGNNMPALSSLYVNEHGQVTRTVEVPTEHPVWYYLNKCQEKHGWTPDFVDYHVRHHPKKVVLSNGQELVMSLKDAYMIADADAQENRGERICIVNFIMAMCYWGMPGVLVVDMAMLPENDPMLILLNS